MGSGSKLKPAVGRLIADAQLAVLSTLPRPDPDGLAPGKLTVSGFLNETLGIGRGGRLTVSAFERAGYQPVAHDLRALWPHRSFSGAPAPCGSGGVWVLHCNPHEAVTALAKARFGDWRSVYRVGYWAWELPRAPRFWLRAAELFHEIWTPSRYVAEALAEVETPVRVMPHAVELDGATYPRPPEYVHGKNYILAAADARSSLTRKNILGAIDIFTTAFPTPAANVRLMLKVMMNGAAPASLNRIRERAASRPDIDIVTRDMDRAESLSFLAHASVLLHPHRAEGYGLMIAEAIQLGRPVLATAWSGNMDYMTCASGMLIPAGLVAVEDDDGVYTMHGAQWAEPDVEVAAKKLRAIVDAPDSVAGEIELVQDRLARASESWSVARLSALPLSQFINSPAG